MKLYNFFLRILLQVGDWSQETQYINTLTKWLKLQRLNADEVAQLSSDRQNQILKYAIENVPFYTQLAIQGHLSAFPVLRKKEIADNFKSLISVPFQNQKLVEEKSSGSSGIQGKVLMSRKEVFDAIAHQTFLWGFSGYRPGDKLLQLGMTTERSGVKRLKDFFFRVDYQSAFNLQEKLVVRVLSKYVGRSDSYFGGYASGLYEYARIAKKNKLNNIRFKAVISWGDKMFDHYRSLIEEAFHSKVFDTYGCTEGFMIAGQCSHMNYHILTPHVKVELLDNQENEVAPGEWGKVVVTRLDAFAMPLIRYYLGDLAVKSSLHEKCECGLPFPLLKKIIGRDTDVVRTPTGKALIVHFFTGIFEHISAIYQFRVVQEVQEKFTIEYISECSDDQLMEVLQKLTLEMNNKAGENLNIEFIRVKEIKPTNSGKPQIISSKL